MNDTKFMVHPDISNVFYKGDIVRLGPAEYGRVMQRMGCVLTVRPVPTAEIKALERYQKRVGQGRWRDREQGT